MWNGATFLLHSLEDLQSAHLATPQCQYHSRTCCAMAVAVPDSFEAVVGMTASFAKLNNVPPLEAVEVFAGSGNLSEALAEHGLAVWKFELQDSAQEDFLSDQDSKGRESKANKNNPLWAVWWVET